MDLLRRKKSEIRPDFGAIINQSERRRKNARINFLTHIFDKDFFPHNRDKSQVASAFEIIINLHQMEVAFDRHDSLCNQRIESWK